ncbi:hypothetical protein Bca101_065561 [Brassica carinata]
MMQMKTDMMERFTKHDEANKVSDKCFNVIFVALIELVRRPIEENIPEECSFFSYGTWSWSDDQSTSH